MRNLLTQKVLANYDQFKVFGIVVFTTEHPNIIKVLKDVDYWNALDQISGGNIAIFATALFALERKMYEPPPGCIGRMSVLDVEPNTNLELFSWFDIRDRKDLPLFILFSFTKGRVFYTKYKISDGSIEETYKSLRNVIALISKHVEQRSSFQREDMYRSLNMRMKMYKIQQSSFQFIELLATFRGALGI